MFVLYKHSRAGCMWFPYYQLLVHLVKPTDSYYTTEGHTDESTLKKETMSHHFLIPISSVLMNVPVFRDKWKIDKM